MNSPENKKLLSFDDYLRLPFEVHYSGAISICQIEFLSDLNVEGFEDVKVAAEQTGRAWGVTLGCSENHGSELACCILNNHDEVAPPWLELVSEAEVDMKSMTHYSVAVNGKEIFFRYLTDENEDPESEGFIDVDGMGPCCSHAMFAYHVGDTRPDYLILDSDNTCVHVNLEGYVLDEKGNQLTERLFDPDTLEDREDLSDYVNYSLMEYKIEWVSRILKTDFPERSDLSLSWSSN